MDVNDPFGVRRNFDAMLDRLEAAVTGHNPTYGPIDNQADIAITHQFMHLVWGGLDHADQQRYAARLTYLKSKGKGQTT